jgi:cytochrome c oxidase cbb3-type subunit 3
MISWKAQLRPSDMQNVASYILTLEGTDPPNQKDKEGELWDRSTQEESASDESTGELNGVRTEL